MKAYQRRAAAREELNKLEYAEFDLTKVLELEPKNKESKESLEKIKLKLGISDKVSLTFCHLYVTTSNISIYNFNQS